MGIFVEAVAMMEAEARSATQLEFDRTRWRSDMIQRRMSAALLVRMIVEGTAWLVA